MSSIAVLKQAIKHVEARDLEPFLAMLSEDCVIMKDNGEVIAKGSAQLRDFYTPVFTSQDDWKLVLSNEFEVGSIVAIKETNIGLNIDGESVDVANVWIYKIVGGKIVYMHVYSPDEQSEEDLNRFLS